MSDIIFTDKIKPITGKTIEIDGEIIVKKVQAENNTYESGAIIPLPSGIIIPFAGRNVPNGFLLCNGQELSREEYSSLFNAIGTDWGAGDGSTTFNVPDLRGAFLRGAGSHGTRNMANGNDFAGPALGNFENDQMQQITGTLNGWSGDNVGLFATASGAFTLNTQDDYINGAASGTLGGYKNSSFNSANSTAQGGARTGDETRPFNAGVNYIIRI